ncbi:2-dehydropantoate 2-reductase [Virgibacillus oceani]|nr:2-dehydropantoate 2-reductase [Virgibacillus oceani]
MNIGVIGGGSIGLLVSALLSYEHTVTIYVRREQQKQALNEYRLSVSNSEIEHPVRALLSNELKKEDCLIVCVKQGGISDIVSMIHKSDQRMPVVFLQNGMGHVDYLKHFNQPIFVGAVEHGALKLSDHAILHTGKGVIKLAAFNRDIKELKTFANQLVNPVFPVCLAEDWEQMLHEKLVINAVINPLTALFDVNNGKLLRNPSLTKLAKHLCGEAALALGLNFQEQWSRVQAVADATKDNVSSMRKDLQEERKTENEAISGYLLNVSKYHIPYTAFVYDSIRALEVMKGIKE